MTSDPSHLAAELFDRIVELTPAGREQFLAQHCPDAQTRRDLESLLAAHEDAGEFFSDGSRAVPSSRDVDPYRAGERIGAYELLEPIGEGGFARVFRARQTQPVRREVALKIVKLGMDTRAVIARFELERQALAMMDHPSIAAVYDAGVTETGRPYFVMELVRGPRLTRYCDEQRLTIPQRLRLFSDVCNAVHHAHQKGILHRDIKPSNLLVTTVDGRPLAKVIDFGIAKAMQERITEATMMTIEQQVLGTPQYMSPEQALSGGTDVDMRSDVYSLGAVLYELLTGVPPLGTAGTPGLGLKQLIGDHEPPLPSTRFSGASASASSSSSATAAMPHRADGSAMDIAASNRGAAREALRRTLRGELDWIITKCLDRDRGRRYESAAALAEDLQAYLEYRPIAAAPPTLSYRARKFARRNTTAVLLGGLVAFAILAGGIVSLTQAIRATRAERLAQARLGEAQSAIATLRAVNDFLTRDMIGSADPAVSRSTEMSVRAALDRAAQAVPSRFPGQPLIEAAVRGSIADAYMTLGRPDLALPHAQHVLDERLNLLGKAHPDTIAAMNARAVALYQLGRSDESEQQARAAFDVARHALGDDHPHTLTALDHYAMAVIARGRWGEAEPVARQLWERGRVVLGDESEKTLTWQNNYARVLQMLGRLDEAEALFKDNWSRRVKLMGEDHPAALTSLNNYALVIKQQGRFADAEPLYRRTLELRRRVVGDDHRDTLASLHNYASLLIAMERHAEAQPLVEEALSRRRHVQGEDHPHTLLALSTCAENLRALGRLDEAITMHRDALTRRRRTLGEDHPDTLSSLNNYAMSLHAAARHGDAEPLLREALERRRRVLGEDHRHTLSSLNNLSRVLADLGRHADAEGLARDALERYRRVVGEAHPETLLILSNYALLLETQGRDADAEPLWAELSRHSTEAQLPPAAAARYASFHGPCLVRLGRYAEAEASLLEAHRRLIATNQTAHARLRHVVSALVELNEKTARPDEAAKWRAELDSLLARPATRSALSV